MRRFGKTKQWMDEMEAYYKANPDAIIVWPSSSWPKVAKPVYDGFRINRVVHDWDDPWYVPIEWIIANPEKYTELMEFRRKNMEAWNKLLDIKVPEGFGKAFISSLVDTGEAMYQTLWQDGDSSGETKSGLKRFFIPAYKYTIDKPEIQYVDPISDELKEVIYNTGHTDSQISIKKLSSHGRKRKNTPERYYRRHKTS